MKKYNYNSFKLRVIKWELQELLFNQVGFIYSISQEVDNYMHNNEIEYEESKTKKEGITELFYNLLDDKTIIKLEFIETDTRLNNVYKVIDIS